MSRAANLFRLQSIDSQLDSLRARLEAIRRALEGTGAVERARVEVAQAEARLEQARRNLRHAEQTVQDQSLKIKDVEGRLYGGAVKNPKELQDLQRDSESLRRHRISLEDRQLEAMAEVESAEAAEAAARTALLAAESDAEHANTELAREKATLEAEVRRLEVEREAAQAVVRPDDLQSYIGLRQRKRGVAVSRLEDGVCASCGVAPSSSRIQVARQGDELIRCGNCERILFA